MTLAIKQPVLRYFHLLEFLSNEFESYSFSLSESAEVVMSIIRIYSENSCIYINMLVYLVWQNLFSVYIITPNYEKQFKITFFDIYPKKYS